MRITVLLVCALLVLSTTGQCMDVEQKWVYTSASLLLDGDVEAIIEVMKDAKAVGATRRSLRNPALAERRM